MKRVATFLIVVLALSAPLWLAASIVDATRIIPVALPLSALQFLAVLLAAVIVIWRGGGSVPALLRRGLDINRIPGLTWRLGVVILMPLLVLCSYGLTLRSSVSVSVPPTPLLSLPVLLLIYSLSAYCEQLGWTAILTDALLTRCSVLAAGLIAGGIWAVWHFIPFLQTHHSLAWVAWQCAFTIAFRVLLTRVYVATNRSVFATIALHATYDTAFSFLPSFGSSYDPQWMTVVTVMAVALLFVGARPHRFRALDRA